MRFLFFYNVELRKMIILYFKIFLFTRNNFKENNQLVTLTKIINFTVKLSKWLKTLKGDYIKTDKSILLLIN